MINDNVNIPKSANNSNYNPFKINTEESVVKEGGNTMRNEDSTFNSKKKKKRLIKSKDDQIKIKSNTPGGKKTIDLKNIDKVSEPQVNNIIIHINNQISTMHSKQHIRVNTINQMREIEALQNAENSNKDRNQFQSPKGFIELQIENNVRTSKYHDRVLETNQSKIFILLNRLLFSAKCEIYYGILVFICSVISIVSLVDIFINFAYMNQLLLFVIEMVIIAAVVFDTGSRIYILKSEYLSNILLILIDIFLAILIPLQIIRFTSQIINIITLILHCVFCFMFTFRFILVLYNLRKSLKLQEDVRQNVEEIINFSEMIEENPKKFEAISHKKQKKMTPAISFVDDHVSNPKKSLNLIKEEANIKQNHENQTNN